VAGDSDLMRITVSSYHFDTLNYDGRMAGLAVCLSH